MRTVAIWFVGLFIVSWGIGGVASYYFLNWLRGNIRNKADQDGDNREKDEAKIKPLYIDNWLIGVMERTFFVVLVAFNLQATGAAIMTWIVVKMAVNWSILLQGSSSRFLRSMGLSALLGNLASMFFAVIGGLICRSSLPPIG